MARGPAVHLPSITDCLWASIYVYISYMFNIVACLVFILLLFFFFLFGLCGLWLVGWLDGCCCCSESESDGRFILASYKHGVGKWVMRPGQPLYIFNKFSESNKGKGDLWVCWTRYTFTFTIRFFGPIKDQPKRKPVDRSLECVEWWWRCWLFYFSSSVFRSVDCKRRQRGPG